MDAAITATGTAIPLSAGQLYRPAELSNLAFSTTAELAPIEGLVGQARALEAIRFGTQVDKAGFNLFVIGPNGARMQDAVKAVLTDEARTKPSPSDWPMSIISPMRIGRSPSNYLPAGLRSSRMRCTN